MKNKQNPTIKDIFNPEIKVGNESIPMPSLKDLKEFSNKIRSIPPWTSGFPKHKCGLILTHNEHLNYYESASEFVTREQCKDAWKDEEAKARAIATNEIWCLQWYPDTPVGFLMVYAPTLEELMEFAMESQTP